MEPKTRRPAGMAAFTTIWLGQLISVLATNMTGFALTIWAYEKTGQATALALVQVFFMAPFLLTSLFAGVMVDRYNRKTMMAVSDIGAGTATIIILVLNAMGVLQVWHLYVAALIQGTFNSFQWPAYSAAISLMVPKEQYGRVNGMMSLVEMGPGVLAPMLAGALLPFIGLTGILTIDVVTFILAVGALMLVFIPQPKQTEEGKKAQGNVFKEASFGFKYIIERPSLLGLQLVFFFANFFSGIGFAIVAPMILSRTGNNELIYGSVQSIGAIGGIVGGIAMSAWGGFKRRVHGVLLGWIFSGITMIFVGWGTGLVVWGVAFFLNALVIPLVNGSNQAIWQAKVAPDLQGRVFSTRRLIAWFSSPLTPLIGATLADYVLEPAMKTNGGLVQTFGWLVGTGPGAGMALIMIVSAIFAGMVGVLGYLFPAVRDAEDLLPDHHQDAVSEPAEQTADAMESAPA
ncbi:MAG TPA: MFS transporter [Anaerolineales bacterium]|nr:MFS transporter [Anaerolineales bacterium]